MTDLAIFDLDGTLVDTPSAIVAAFGEVFATAGDPVPSPERIRDTVGMPLERAFGTLLGADPADPLVARYVEGYRRVFREQILPRGPALLFPGVAEGLAELRAAGVELAVATNKMQSSAEAILEATGIGDLFTVVVGADRVRRPKPDPETAHTILDACGVPGDRAIMVGDTTHDLAMAGAAGIRSLAVSYGVHPPELLRPLGPIRIADSFADVVATVRAARTGRPVDPEAVARVHLLGQTGGLRALHTVIRDRTVPRDRFVRTASRIMRLLLEEAIGLLPHEPYAVATPPGNTYHGLRPAADVCGVSIPRAGDSMEGELRAVCPEVRIGKILLQRDPVTKLPVLHLATLPSDVGERHVLLLDPMLATGGTAGAAVRVLTEHGVPEERIVLVTLLASPEGLTALSHACPGVRVVTSAVEERLDANAFMVPGIGDFGDRFYGTDAGPAVDPAAGVPAAAATADGDGPAGTARARTGVVVGAP